MPPSVTPRLCTGAPVRRHVPLLRVRFVMARVAAALFIATVGAAFAPRARADCWDVAANRYRLDPLLLYAIAQVESNLDLAARNVNRNGTRDIGLMQIKPATARMLGYSGSVKGLYDPETNIKYGMKYLAMAHELGGGTTCGTILKYNAGHAAKRMNPVSAAYCSKVKVQMAAAATPA